MIRTLFRENINQCNKIDDNGNPGSQTVGNACITVESFCIMIRILKAFSVLKLIHGTFQELYKIKPFRKAGYSITIG